MAIFDFITDEQFRASLESDYTELQATIEVRAWKAAHVLAGSIVEAVLVDYLMVTDYFARQRSINPRVRERDIQPLEMSLGALIEACKTEGILSERSASLSTVVQGYRNLIHPGRLIREQEIIDENGARVAKSLVEMIVAEVSQRRQQTFGPTAVQIVSKVYQDPDAVAFIDSLLNAVHPSELERLLLHELPNTYLHNLSFVRTFGADPSGLDALKWTFRVAFDLAAPDLKTKVAKRFVTILRQEAKQTVQDYGEAFFTASDMDYLPSEDVSLVKQHLMSRIKKGNVPPHSLMGLISGFGRHIDSGEEAADLAGALSLFIAAQYREITPTDTRLAFWQLYTDMKSVAQNTFAATTTYFFALGGLQATSPDQADWIKQARPSLAQYDGETGG